MRTSDNKEPNFLVATSNTNMCSHPHTVCTESVGQGYGGFTAQLDRQDTRRVKDSEIMCCSCAQIKTRGRKSHIPYMLRGTKPLLTRTHSILHTVPGVCVDPRRAIKIIHTSMYQVKGQVYNSPPLRPLNCQPDCKMKIFWLIYLFIFGLSQRGPAQEMGMSMTD